jgi:beta-1,4-mannosyltransferase
MQAAKPSAEALSVAGRRFAVLVLGDLGRSPRMQYHALALAAHGADVDLIGFAGSPLPEALRENRRVRIHLLPPPRLAGRHRLPRSLFLAYALLRTGDQSLRLLRLLLLRLPPPDVLLVQNPPAVPTLLIAWLAVRARAAKLVIDWHNFGHSMLALSVGAGHPAVRFARWYERKLGTRADADLCVSRAMQAELAAGSGIASSVLHDRPAESFTPIAPEARCSLLRRLRGQIRFPTLDGPEDERPAILVSPTGWTADEDLSLLLAAVDRCEARIAALESSPERRPFPQLLVLVTGTGPLREQYEKKIERIVPRKVHLRTLWLPPEDYVRLLGAADLGLCFHRSSSGLDLPMKVADMLGAGLPVCALDYGPCLAEQIRHGENGLLFRTSAELAELLCDLFAEFPGNAARLAELRRNVLGAGGPRWQDAWAEVALPLFARLTSGRRP